LKVTQQIRALSQTATYQKQATLLKSIPGIGLLTAMTILTELESMDRFPNLDKMCGYISGAVRVYPRLQSCLGCRIKSKTCDKPINFIVRVSISGQY
jgi:transposase